MCMSVYEAYANASAHRGQSHKISLELELQIVMSGPMWVMGTKFKKSSTFVKPFLGQLTTCAELNNVHTQMCTLLSALSSFFT